MRTIEQTHKKSNYRDYELKEVIKANELLHKKKKSISRKTFNEILEIKEARVKGERKLQPLFFHIGMSVSLLLMILAFNWKSYDTSLVDLGSLDADAEEFIDIPISRQPPPPPPEKVPEVYLIKEVEDEEIIEELDLNLDVEVTSDQKIEVIEYVAPEIEEEVIEEIFTIVENAPEPVGGLAAFNKYLSENVKYPTRALNMGIGGMVFVQFVVEKDGSLTEAKVVKGIGAGCDEEALRVINNAPKWIPGKQRGKAVRVYKIVPIRFLLRN